MGVSRSLHQVTGLSHGRGRPNRNNLQSWHGAQVPSALSFGRARVFQIVPCLPGPGTLLQGRPHTVPPDAVSHCPCPSRGTSDVTPAVAVSPRLWSMSELTHMCSPLLVLRDGFLSRRRCELWLGMREVSGARGASPVLCT